MANRKPKIVVGTALGGQELDGETLEFAGALSAVLEKRFIRKREIEREYQSDVCRDAGVQAVKSLPEAFDFGKIAEVGNNMDRAFHG